MTGFARLLGLLLLALLCAPAYGEDGVPDEKAPDEKAPAAARPPSESDELMAAYEAGDLQRFEDLAKSATTEAWAMADLLVIRGAPDAALAFALAVGGPDTARLPAYLEGRRNRAPEEKIRSALDAADAAARDEFAAHVEKLAAVAGQGDSFERVIVEHRRAQLLRELGRYAEAAECFASAARTAERLGWLALAARSFNEGAFSSYKALDFDGMVSGFTRLAAVEHGRGRASEAGDALMNLGCTHGLLGDYTAADRYFAESEAAYTVAKSPAGTAHLLRNRAEIYLNQGRHADARASLERARSLIEREKEPELYADLDMLLGSLFLQLEQPDRAMELYQQAKRVFVAAKDEESIANAIGNIGLVQLERKEYVEALESMNVAISIHERLGNHGYLSIALSNKGWLLMQQGEYRKARPFLERAVAVARKIEDVSAEANALDNLADTERNLGRVDEAIEMHKAVLRIGTRSESARLQLRGLGGLAEDWLAKGDPGRAFRAAERALDHSLPLVSGLGQEQAADARKQLTRLYEVTTRAAVAWENPAALLTAMESARAGALLESLENRQAIRTASIPEALQKSEQEARRNAQIAMLRYQQAVKAGMVRGIRRQKQALDAAREELHAVVGQIQRKAKAAASVLYPVAATLEEVQESLEPGDTFVSYSLLGEKAVALILTREAARIADLGDVDVLETAAALPLSDPDTDAAASIGELRALLVEPLKLGKTDKRLLISPDGVLGYVPFSALVGDRTVSQVPSATAYRTLLGQAVVQGRGVLALGDPDYGTRTAGPAVIAERGGMDLIPLPATKKEAESVGDVVLLGKKATKSGLLAALAGRARWRALHLACHGLVDPEHPMRSALALSFEEDGGSLLTCLDVARSKIPADLAVLSACETGKGKLYRSEGIVGLTQAFMLAGAPRVLVSLWKVDDVATQALMTNFYELWRGGGEDGMPAADALAGAQAHVRAQEKWQHPYYWAAWVLWGLPR